MKACKNLEEINFDLTVQDIQFTLDLPKLKKVKNGEYNAISGKHLLETKLNQLNARLENETKFHEFLAGKNWGQLYWYVNRWCRFVKWNTWIGAK